MSRNLNIKPVARLTAVELRVKQGRLNWTNKQLAIWCGVSTQTISNWRHNEDDRGQTIPLYLGRLLEFAGLVTNTDMKTEI
jgi:hypothetical protein